MLSENPLGFVIADDYFFRFPFIDQGMRERQYEALLRDGAGCVGTELGIYWVNLFRSEGEVFIRIDQHRRRAAYGSVVWKSGPAWSAWSWLVKVYSKEYQKMIGEPPEIKINMPERSPWIGLGFLQEWLEECHPDAPDDVIELFYQIGLRVLEQVRRAERLHSLPNCSAIPQSPQIDLGQSRLGR